MGRGESIVGILWALTSNAANEILNLLILLLVLVPDAAWLMKQLRFSTGSNEGLDINFSSSSHSNTHYLSLCTSYTYSLMYSCCRFSRKHTPAHHCLTSGFELFLQPCWDGLIWKTNTEHTESDNAASFCCTEHRVRTAARLYTKKSAA